MPSFVSSRDTVVAWKRSCTVFRNAFSNTSGGLTQAESCCADAERKHHMPASPNVRPRLGSENLSSRLAASLVRILSRSPAFSLEMLCLRLAGGAGGERDQAHIVARRVEGGEVSITRRAIRSSIWPSPIEDAPELPREGLVFSISSNNGIAQRG